MSFPPRKRWPGLALLAAALLLAGALALTWANGPLTRHVLREQVQVQGADPASAWTIEIAELAGGFTATSYRFLLHDRLDRGLRLEVSGQLEHRLLTTNFTGNLYAMPSPQRPLQVGREALASFRGQARYRPIVGIAWSARLQGQGAQLRMEGLDWDVGPWSADLEGGRSAVMLLSLPKVTLQGMESGTATIRGAHFDPVSGAGRAGALGPQVSGHGRVESLELRLPQGFAEASDVSLAVQIRRDQDGWPFGLQLGAAELVYKGFPFTRMSGLSYQVDGRASPVASGEPQGRARGNPTLEWRATQSLEGRSDYGSLHGEALAVGVVGPDGVPQLSELRVTGLIPQGLWSVLERLNAGLAAQLTGVGMVHREGGQLLVRAEYRRGGWRGLVADP